MEYLLPVALKRICECIVRDEKSILPISLIHEIYGIEDITLSMPAILRVTGNRTTSMFSKNIERNCTIP